MRVNAHKQNRKIYKMSEFRGVDYSSSPLEVKPYRATDMANLILKDGTLHKRNGWEQIKKVVIGDAEKILTVLVHRGYIIIQSKGTNVKTHFLIFNSEFDKVCDAYIGGGFSDAKASAVEVNGKLYIACGDYLVFNSEEETLTSLVHSRDAFVPTTTINIPRMDRLPIYEEDAETGEMVEVGEEWVADENVKYPNKSKDHTNLLSWWRKNVLIGAECNPNSKWQASLYVLDGYASGEEDRYPILEVRNKSSGYTQTLNDFKRVDKTVGTRRGSVWESETTGIQIGDQTMFMEDKFPRSSRAVTVVNIPMSLTEIWGIPLKEAEIGIIYFENSSWIGNPNVIGGCNIATIFGVNGANDRIFLAGGIVNSNLPPNRVYYSENNEGGLPEPTYFPSNNQIVCGSEDSAISAFMRVSDGTLAVFKDVTNTADVSTYYIGGFYQSLGEGEEGNEYYQAVFNIKAGAIKQKGISATTVANFEGDPIFVSSEGVYGIQLSSNVASGERYAKERSRVVNTKLKGFDLSKANGIAFNGKYYLAVGGEHDEVYVADSRYKYRQEGDSEDSFNYEWFRWTNVPAAAWFEYNNRLYFISKDGWICRMTDGYADVYLASSGDSQLAVCKKSEGTGYYVAFNEALLPIIQKAAYALDQDGNYWTIENLSDTHTVDGVIDSFDVPSEITVTEGQELTLRFHLPINAHWKSAIIDLENSMRRKNLWSLSTTVIPTEGGFVKVGYKTRYNERMPDQMDKQVEGAYSFSFDDIDFSMFNFDCGGFINAFRRRVFERGFIYMQLGFMSESVGDCVVTEIAVEYSPTIKNMGVG